MKEGQLVDKAKEDFENELRHMSRLQVSFKTDSFVCLLILTKSIFLKTFKIQATS